MIVPTKPTVTLSMSAQAVRRGDQDAQPATCPYFRDHPPPHFHARYGDHVAEVAIDTLAVIDGWLPQRALRLTLEWAGEHEGELRANWDRARAHEALVAIDPLP
jgi:hypothetical protein